MDAAHPIALAWTWTAAHAWATGLVATAALAIVGAYAVRRTRRERSS